MSSGVKSAIAFHYGLALGPLRPLSKLAFVRGGRWARGKLLHNIYGCNPEELKDSSQIPIDSWRRYFPEVFDLTSSITWARKHADILYELDRRRDKLPVAPNLPDTLKVALVHQSSRIEGYKLQHTDSDAIFAGLRPYWQNGNVFENPPRDGIS